MRRRSRISLAYLPICVVVRQCYHRASRRRRLGETGGD
jgi:hypothetical protein